MNILYISNLSGNLFAGPNNSVPAQISAQALSDNVFWYNLNHIKREEWKSIGCCNFDDYPTGRLKDLPLPFSKPDLAVVEEFYCYPYCKILKDIVKAHIPFIIIPRSELTEQAQKKKLLKKKIGNILYFKRLAKKANAIQFLSEQERIDSGTKWSNKNIIIPNGTIIPSDFKNTYSKDEIKAVYIGRFETYQKGIDLLIDAIDSISSELKRHSFKLYMYGVNQEGSIEKINKQIYNKNLQDLIVVNEAVYGKEKEDVLMNADLFVLTSRFEGMPMGLIEALAYGVPCLITKGTNMCFDVERYNAGWTSDVSVESIKKSILQMLEEHDRLSEKGYNARKLALTYSWDEIAKRSSREYQKLLRG